MPSREVNPVEYVAAPMRSALEAIVTRGGVAFALAVGAVGITATPVGEDLRILSYHALPALLVLYLLIRQLAVALEDGVDDRGAWSRAREIDPNETAFARLVALSVPAGTLFAGAALLYPHLAEADDRVRVLAVFLPIFGLLWVAVTFAWTDECRARLARAAVECDRRFRAYWAGVGRV